MSTVVFQAEINPATGIPLAEFFSILKHFSPTEKERLKKTLAGMLDHEMKQRIQRIVTGFNAQIASAVRLEKTNFRNLADITKKGDGGIAFPDPNLGEGGYLANALELTSFHLVRSNGYLQNLQRAKEIFLDNPEGYGVCRDCGQPIPTDRLEEVPHTGHCVPCKDKDHSYE